MVAGALLVLSIPALALGPLANVIESFDGERVSSWVEAAGIWGPVLIVSLMTIAIVATPIPSAPIALAAGAAYGHALGTVYIVVGAELGALIAFALARFLGRDALVGWLGRKVDAGWLGSQNALTFTVFASRLMPFISFDIVSYAAGLSRLHFWRFAVATLVGIIPASFVLAHFGGEATSGNLVRATWAVLGLGLVTGLPLLWMAMRRRSEKGAPDHG
ncbi:VTT domain-containing protein [Aliiroseovarius sp. F47248L]|uniref:TVP38/TMEM64 family protein n=1 Tax=Aliiroseovarius sp. F47248L TaxID=2926420 RepID=UPI001FF447A5|nr:VTT domain-containing protein [Aliiroseovarius sp. F47248L]MCK0137913.1 VTT domain-containing protein [Aliiroseovarius sp. F47248L]